MRKLATSSIVILLIVFSLLMMIGCQEQSEPSYQLPEKGNPKLDSQLNQLVQAEMRGEAALFAEQNNIALIDGRVRVIVECSPGQVDAADEAVSAAGVVESRYGDLLQAVVPVSSLTALADKTSIRLIRLPQQPVPGGSQVK